MAMKWTKAHGFWASKRWPVGALIAFFVVFPRLLLAEEVAQPIAAWNCALPAGLTLGEQVLPNDLKSQQGTGSNEALKTIRILAPEDAARAVETKIYWLKTPDDHPAVSLSSPMLNAIDAPAAIAAHIEFGNTLAPPLDLHAFTACLKFKLTGPLYYGGSPPSELDGKLVSLSSALDIGILGSGPTGKLGRRVYIQFNPPSSPPIRFVAATGSAITINQWTSLLVSWEAGTNAQSSPGPKLWIDGKPVTLQATGNSTFNQPLTLRGPISVGGDGASAAVPMELQEVAVYDKTVSWENAFAPVESAAVTEVNNADSNPAHTYMPLADLSAPDAWDISAEGWSASSTSNGTLALKFDPIALGKKGRIILRHAVEVRASELFQFWLCMPAFSGPEAENLVQAIFVDASGTETLVPAVDCCNTHIAPPNGRATGQWQVITLSTPLRKGTCQFRGFQIDYQGASYPLPRYLYLRDFGVDRIDYRKARLYYVVANYRDNFSMVAFNGSGAHALTDLSGGTPYPFLLLDNSIDQAKDGRPKNVDLQLECFDAQDRLVWSSFKKDLDASDELAMFQKIQVPVTQPGTYWIESKSYDTKTGEYFTTDWTQLIVIRGPAMAFPSGEEKRHGLLYINPEKPFGRLEKTDPRVVNFRIGEIPQTEKGKPPDVLLKYAIVPYAPWLPMRDAIRAVPLTTTIRVQKSGTISVPYQPQSSVELVLAELWINGKRMDREERPIGIRNDLSAAPPQDPSIPGIKELSASTGGLLINSHFDSLLDRAGNQALNVFTKSLDEAKKISPLVEFIPSLARLEPIPGVYDWDYLQQYFDAARAHQCSVVLYLMQKWPTSWAPVDFMENEDGRVHHLPVVWGHMVGAYNYSTGENGPRILKDFNQQLARRFINERGFAAYYFENEHIPGSGPNSYDAGNRKNFQDFLRTRYQDLAALDQAYGTAYASFDEVQIPTSDIVDFPRKIEHADWQEYRSYAAEKFTLGAQFDTVRAEDKRRPIMVYTVGMEMSGKFLAHIASEEGLITNGGVHSVLDADVYREQFCSVPGLLERMEPHDVWHYEPFPHGFDEMIFGMLGLGGRGMNFHFIVKTDPYQIFSFGDYRNDGPAGYGKFLSHLSAIEELRQTEKLHDPVGILQLRDSQDYTLGAFHYPIRAIMSGIYVNNHYEPKVYHSGMDLKYLDGSGILIVTGDLLDESQADYLAAYLKGGGHVVLDDTAASICFENPDGTGNENYLLKTLGIDSMAAGDQIPGLNLSHDVYPYGSGSIAWIRNRDLINKWAEVTPLLMSWAGVKRTLADSADPYMQMHTLRGPDADYLAVTHRGFDQNAYDGPREWSGKIKYLAASDKQKKFEVSQIWADQQESLRVLSGQDLANGFDAGHFDELEMKLYRIRAVK
jgi:hypothetical protein